MERKDRANRNTDYKLKSKLNQLFSDLIAGLRIKFRRKTSLLYYPVYMHVRAHTDIWQSKVFELKENLLLPELFELSGTL